MFLKSVLPICVTLKVSQLIRSKLWPQSLNVKLIYEHVRHLPFRSSNEPRRRMKWTSVYFTLNLKNRHISCWETMQRTKHPLHTQLWEGRLISGLYPKFHIKKWHRYTEMYRYHILFTPIIHRLKKERRRQKAANKQFLLQCWWGRWLTICKISAFHFFPITNSTLYGLTAVYDELFPLSSNSYPQIT